GESQNLQPARWPRLAFARWPSALAKASSRSCYRGAAHESPPSRLRVWARAPGAWQASRGVSTSVERGLYLVALWAAVHSAPPYQRAPGGAGDASSEVLPAGTVSWKAAAPTTRSSCTGGVTWAERPP